MIDSYTRVLVAIPAALLAGTLFGLHPSIALHEGLAGGSLLSGVFLYDALFRNPPVSRKAATTATAMVGVGLTITLLLTV